MKEKLAKLAELLLDTGKRNNLINFKDNKSNTAEIVAPSFEGVTKKLSGNYVFEVYDPKLDTEDEGGRLTDNKLKEILKNKWDFVARYESKLSKTSQVLVYYSSISPIKALKNIEKKWRSAIEETGVNIAYLAIGFVSWYEGDKVNEKYTAPLLLAPISLARKSNVDPYRVSVSVDDMILNPTFAYKMQSEYNVTLPEYDEEIDESINDYLLRVGDVISKLKWSILKICKIGLFSFLKINMYRDLKDNAELIESNNNVRKILGETYTQNQSGEKAEARYNVVDADSSQLKAIEMAKSGESFVLQGPPGTGKSQTITNIIAECIADGKKVLFVSEKLAALNVVYNKLKQAGLEDFCLQLHSHKVGKKDFVQELCRTMRLEKSGVSSKAAQEEDRLNKSHVILDAYVEQLHSKNEIIGKSLFELVEEVCACKNSTELDYFIDDVKSKGEKYVDTAADLLEQYAQYCEYIGYNYKEHPWYGYIDKDVSAKRKFDVKKSIGEIKDICQDADDIANEINREFSIESVAGFEKIRLYGKLFDLLSISRYISPRLLNHKSLKATSDTAKNLRPLAEEIKKLRLSLKEGFNDALFALDGKGINEILVKNSGMLSRLFNKDYKKSMTDLNSCSKSGKVSYKQALQASGVLQEYQNKLKDFEEQQGLLQKNLTPQYCKVDSDWDVLTGELDSLQTAIENISDFGALTLKSDGDFELLRGKFGEYADKCKTLADRVDKERDFIDCFDRAVLDITALPFDALFKRMSRCCEDIDSLDNWNRFALIYEKLKQYDLLAFIDAAIAKSVPVEDFESIFKRIFYTQWIDEILIGDEFLQTMTRVTHDKTVGIFAQKDVRNFEISKAKIRSMLSALRPDLDYVAPGSAVANLLNEGNKKRRLKPIRVLLGEIRELAQTLKPCFLMSPLSVSTYLTSDIKFDVVIFDEASQIFPQDAIGAIYRGNQVIVVGDSKQMPPSNFFMTISDGDEYDDGGVDAKDFESVLDLCATVLPQLRLKWHYRSRYESLIDFSNKQFYDGDLVTFPSSKVDRDGDGIGVDFHFVEKGYFDHKSRTNRAEAEYIVGLVFDNIEKYPDRSLGVVAFSISQQDLIENLISKRRAADPSKENFFSTDNAEPFFVKNLETVQGDERDTIIFSVAYARDKDGKMSHNFGPINKAGGERRLNVAITRAKLNVQLVASIHSSDIDTKRAESVGARLLKEYIGYAERGVYASPNVTANSDNDIDMFEFEMEVAEFLRSNGYEVDTKVGASASNVDIGVRLPGGDDYILAVECDGRAYKNADNTRDRDRLRGSVLSRMGWHYHRVWAIDWIKNKKDEKERLISAVKDALEPHEYAADASSTDSLDEFEEKIDSASYQFSAYEAADIKKAKAATGGDYLAYVRKVLEKEAPLSEELFLKRTLRDFSREKLTDGVWEKFNRLMSHCASEGIERRDGFMYLKNREIKFRLPDGNFVREIKYISLEELAAGMAIIIQKNVSLQKTGLYKLIAKLLGFSKLGEAMTVRFDCALELIKDGLDIEGEIISVKG